MLIAVTQTSNLSQKIGLKLCRNNKTSYLRGVNR